MNRADTSHVLKLSIQEPCQHPDFKHFGGSVEIPGSAPVLPVTILVCATCGQQVVVPVILNACQAE